MVLCPAMRSCFHCGDAHSSTMCPVREIQRQGQRVSDQLSELGARGTSALDRVSESMQELRQTVADEAEFQREALGEDLRRLGDTVGQSFRGLASIIDYHHAETIWLQQKQLDALAGIGDTLRSPRATEAAELLEMARQCLDTGMVADALRLVGEGVEKNPLDHRLYVVRAFAFVAQDKPESALEALELALRHARTTSARNQTLLYLARSLRSLGKYEAGFQRAIEGFALAPSVSDSRSIESAFRGEATRAVTNGPWLSCGHEAVAIAGDWSKAGELRADMLERVHQVIGDLVDREPSCFEQLLSDQHAGLVPGMRSLLEGRHAKACDDLDQAETLASSSLAASKPAEVERIRRMVREARASGVHHRVLSCVPAVVRAALSVHQARLAELEEDERRIVAQWHKSVEGLKRDHAEVLRMKEDEVTHQARDIRGDTTAGGLAFLGAFVGGAKECSDANGAPLAGLLIGGAVGGALGFVYRVWRRSFVAREKDAIVSRFPTKLAEVEAEKVRRLAAINSLRESATQGLDAFLIGVQELGLEGVLTGEKGLPRSATASVG